MPKVYPAMRITLWRPTTWKDTLETFHQATTRPYGYLMLDLHPASSDQQRVLSHLLKDEGWTRTYQKRV